MPLSIRTLKKKKKRPPPYPRPKNYVDPKPKPLETFIDTSRRYDYQRWISKVNLYNETQISCGGRLALNRLCPRRDDNTIMGRATGFQRLYHKKYNQSLAFTRDERIFFHFNALLPFGAHTEEEQLQYFLIKLDRMPDNIDKYYYLLKLSEYCERLFYLIVKSDVKKFAPVIYTPTVAKAVQTYSTRWVEPKGLFITYDDKGHIGECLKQWPERSISAICVTDGERILGIGDWGANGMPIAVGKCMLYTAFGGLKPYRCLPITIDVGTNNESLLNDPLYIGMKRKRITGTEYIEFMDEFMQAVEDRYGCACLVQFEDFGRNNALFLIDRYQKKYCCFNDDMQGTACVVVACLLNAIKPTNIDYKDHVLLFVGAGQAAIGIGKLYEMAMIHLGVDKEIARNCIWFFDSRGLVIRCRPKGQLEEYKLIYAHYYKPIACLLEAITEIRPTILIGVSAVGGKFTPKILAKMAEINEIPIIFALSNPTEKSECTANDAYTYTNGKCLFASGSPFPPVEYEDRTYYPSQCNNSFIFPGLIFGSITVGLTHIPNELFLLLSKKLASLVTYDEIEEGSLLPNLEGIRDVSVQISATVMEYAFRNRVSGLRIEPIDKILFLRAQMYEVHYKQLIPYSFYENKHDLERSSDDEEEERQLATLRGGRKKSDSKSSKTEEVSEDDEEEEIEEEEEIKEPKPKKTSTERPQRVVRRCY